MDTQTTIINGLSELIASARQSLYAEECYPTSSADESDDKMKKLRVRIDTLRQSRDELEKLFYGGSV